MLSRLEMKLESPQKLSVQMGSLFHGALMEMLDTEYVAYLHTSQIRPYSQHLMVKNGEIYWIVKCLNEDVQQKIIQECLLKLNEVEIKKEDIKIKLKEKTYIQIPMSDLSKRFYENDASRYIHLHFYTPVSFKQQGKYVFYPDIRLIYQSLMNKYDFILNEDSMVDNDALEELCRCSEIIWYDLKSVKYRLEGITIPAFVGKITIKISGTQTMANFANMLFEYGEYSGIGIKTALGMGAVKITKGRQKT